MAKTRYHNDKLTSQRSIRYHINKKTKARDSYASLYPHMFIEDLRLGIMPIGWQPQRFKFTCEVEPKSSEVEKLISNGLPTRHGAPQYFTEALCDFVEETTHILSYYGKAFYEIVYIYNDDKKSKIGGFHLINIANHNIKTCYGLYWQYIPKEILKYRIKERQFMPQGEIDGNKDKRFIWLPRKYMFVLNFPKQFGGKNKLRSILSNLAWASQETIPKFSMRDLEIQKQQPGYDFSTYRDNQDIFILKLTKELGWPARSLSSDKILEFYQLYRYLKYARTQAILREYIIGSLNEILNRIGKDLGFKAKVIIKNCLSSRELEKHMKNLIDGKLQFSELVNLTKIT